MPHPTSGPPCESSPPPGSAPAANALRADGVDGAHRPLPPLPDGGLAAAMPDWLRADPERADPPSLPAPDPPGAALEPAAAPAAGLAPIDPTTFVTEADLPAWIRRLVADDAPAAAAPAASPIAVRLITPGSDSNPGTQRLRPPPRPTREPVRRTPRDLAPARPPIRPEVPPSGIRPAAARPPRELPAAPGATVPPQRPTPSPPWRDGRSSTVAWVLAAALLLLAVLSILVGTGAIP